jgi:uncharacterized membrane protein
MEQETKNSEKWIESVGDLVGAYRDLITIKAVEHASLGISVSVSSMLSLITAIFILLFGGLGAAWWLGEYLQNMKAGYFIVAGLYTLVLFILLAISQKIIVPGIRNIIIKKMYEQD